MTIRESYSETSMDKRVSCRKSEERKIPQRRSPWKKSQWGIVTWKTARGPFPWNGITLAICLQYCSSQRESQSAQVVPLISSILSRCCGLESIARVLLDTWMDGRDLLFQLARRLLSGHSSSVIDRSPRDLISIPFCPVSEVWESISSYKKGTRLREVSASSDLNDWLLLVITVLNWSYDVKSESVFVGPPSKVQTRTLSLLVGEVSQFFHQYDDVMEEVIWNQKLQARISHCRLRRDRVLHCRMFEFEKNLRSSFSSAKVWSIQRTSAQVLWEKFFWILVLYWKKMSGRCSCLRFHDMGLRFRLTKACSGFGES